MNYVPLVLSIYEEGYLLLYMYVDPHIDKKFVSLITETLQTDVLFTDDPSQAQLIVSTSFTSHATSFLIVFNQNKLSFPDKLPSTTSGCVIVDPNTMEVISRDVSYLTIMITGRCNTLCSYCHLEPTREDDADPEKVISTLRHLQMSYEIEYVRFSGGEPTLDLSLIQKCNTLFEKTRKGISTNGIYFKDVTRVPVRWMGFDDMCVHFVKYLKEESCIDMFGMERTYDETAIMFRRKYGSSDFFNFPILITPDNVHFVRKFFHSLRKHQIYNIIPFVETDRYGNFNINPTEICKVLNFSQDRTNIFLHRLIRNKYMSLYYRAPYDDFVDSCYGVLGEDNQRKHWIERMSDLPFDLSTVSFARKRGWI